MESEHKINVLVNIHFGEQDLVRHVCLKIHICITLAHPTPFSHIQVGRALCDTRHLKPHLAQFGLRLFIIKD